MDGFEQQLQKELRVLSEPADSNTERRVLEAVRRASRGDHRPWLAVGLGMAAAAAVIAALNATGVLGGGTAARDATANSLIGTPAINGDGPNGVAIGEPCPGARHAADPAQLSSNTTPVWLPANAAGKVTDAWICDDVTPVVMFGNIQVSYETRQAGEEAGVAGEDLKVNFEQLAKGLGGKAHVESILGRPALVQPADADDNNEVIVVVNATLIRLLAEQGVPIQQLVDLANSLEVPTN